MSTAFIQPGGHEAYWLPMPADAYRGAPPRRDDRQYFNTRSFASDPWWWWALRAAGSPSVWGPERFRVTASTRAGEAVRFAAAHGRVDNVESAAQWIADTLPRSDSQRASSPVRVSDFRPLVEAATGELSDLEFTAAVVYSGHDLASMDMATNPRTTVSKIGLDWYSHRAARTAFNAGRSKCRWLDPVTVSTASLIEALDRIPVNEDGDCQSVRKMSRAEARRCLPEIQSLADQLVDTYPATPIPAGSSRSRRRFANSHSLRCALENDRGDYVRVGHAVIAAAVAGYDVIGGRRNAAIGVDENVAQMLRARGMRTTRPHGRRAA